MYSNIYVISIRTGRGKSFIKIGYANNFEKRLSTFRVSCPLEIKIELVLRVPLKKVREIEKNLHQALKEFRVRGEWFSVSKKQKEILNNQILDLRKSNDALLVRKKPSFEEIQKYFKEESVEKTPEPVEEIEQWDGEELERVMAILEKMSFGQAGYLALI